MLKIIIVTLLFGFFSIVYANKTEYVAPPMEPLKTNYEVELESWIEKLAKCESGNNPLAVNHYDGGSRSVGYVQYKDDTWKRYIDKFQLSFSAEDIWSKEAQIEVTKHVITEDYAWKNWYNCVTKYNVGLPPKP